MVLMNVTFLQLYPLPWFSTQGKTVMHMTQTIPKFNYLIIFFELL